MENSVLARGQRYCSTPTRDRTPWSGVRLGRIDRSYPALVRPRALAAHINDGTVVEVRGKLHVSHADNAMTARYIAAMVLALALGCAWNGDGAVAPVPNSVTAGQGEVPIGQPFTLRRGQYRTHFWAKVDSHVRRVLEDSRCPVDTTCFWAGDAVVRLRLQAARAENALLDLHTHANYPQEGNFQKHRMRLVGLAPARRDNSTIPSENYVATVVVFEG